MTVVTCDSPARSYNFDIPNVGKTLRGGAFLTLPGLLPSPSTPPTRPRSPGDRRRGLVEMSDLASALAVQLDPPPLDIVLEAVDASPIAPTARESDLPLRCHRSLAVPHLVGEEEEDCQEDNSRLMDDLLQSIDEEVEFYNSFGFDEQCDDISDDTFSSRKHTYPTWNFLDFFEAETSSLADDDVDLAVEMNGCNKHLSPTLAYLEFLDDDMRVLQDSSEDCALSSSSKQGIYSTDDEFTSALQELSRNETETSLNHVSTGGSPESVILDLIRLLDEETIHYQQPIHDSIPRANGDEFDLLRFVNGTCDLPRITSFQLWNSITTTIATTAIIPGLSRSHSTQSPRCRKLKTKILMTPARLPPWLLPRM